MTDCLYDDGQHSPLLLPLYDIYRYIWAICAILSEAAASALERDAPPPPLLLLAASFILLLLPLSLIASPIYAFMRRYIAHISLHTTHIYSKILLIWFILLPSFLLLLLLIKSIHLFLLSAKYIHIYILHTYWIEGFAHAHFITSHFSHAIITYITYMHKNRKYYRRRISIETFHTYYHLIFMLFFFFSCCSFIYCHNIEAFSNRNRDSAATMKDWIWTEYRTERQNERLIKWTELIGTVNEMLIPHTFSCLLMLT